MPHRHRSVRVRLRTLLAAGFVLALSVAPGRSFAAAVAVGTNGIAISSNTVGSTWGSPVTINGNVSFGGIWMTSDANGVAVGNGNSIHRTGNGGSSWTPVVSPITTTYNDVMFPTATTGYIAATNGNVLKTTNGGTNWTAQGTGSAAALLGVHFVSATQGCAVGNSGAIFRTTDGGANWLDETTGTANLFDVHFADASNGWAVGTGGTILRTTNGGDSWSSVTSGTTVDLMSVWFTSATLGFVCGGDRVIRRTTNGGTSWSAVTLPATNQQSGLFDLMFADPDSGIVVGSGVNAYRTIDGGTTWTVANPDPTSEVLQAVHLRRPPGPPPQVTVNVNALPAGRSFRVDGQTFTTPQVFTWDAGSAHTLEGVTPQAISAGEQYVFSAWSGGSTSTATSIQVSPTTNAAYTANYQRQFRLTMTTETGGSVSPSSSWQNAGSSPQVSANESQGYDFAGWVGTGSGSYTGPNNPATITMSGPIAQAANFAPIAITLTFQTSPAGRQVVVDGTARTTPYVLQTTADVAHTLDVPSPQGEANGSRLAFNTWSDGGAKAHTIDPLGGGTYTANLKTQYFLTTLASPTNGGTLLPVDGWHDAGTVVALDPNPSLGFGYYLMTGTGTGAFTGLTSMTARCTMNGPITQTANFSNATLRTITLVTDPPGPSLSVGTLDVGSSERFVWPSGQSLSISAPSTQEAVASVKRWQWTRWSQGGLRTQNVTPTSNVTYTAYFDVQFRLTMEAEAGGTTSPPVGESWIDSNTVVAITALPDANHSFFSWSGSGSSSYNGSNNPAQFTIRGRVNELARFDLLPQITLDPGIAGRSFVAGEPETIRWSANFASITPYPVEYKHATSASWSLIASATPQTGFVVWNPPDSPQANLSLRIRDPNDGNPGDTLGVFRICDPYFSNGPTIAGLGAGVRANDVEVGDLNGDGVPDLVLGLGNGGLQRRMGQAGGATSDVGTGGFGTPSTVIHAGAVVALELGDLDRDGNLDVVGSLAGFGNFRYWLGAGDGTLGGGTSFVPDQSNAKFALADVTEDGWLDVITARAGILRVFRLDPAGGAWSGGYTELPTVATAANVADLEIADVNLDGVLDAIVLAQSPAGVTIHLGAQGPQPGSGGFGPARSVVLAGTGHALELADFNENARLDALVIALGAPPVVLTDLGSLGPTQPIFARRDTVTTGNAFNFGVIGDFDRDGHLDVALSATTMAEVQIHGGAGDGSFELRTRRQTGGALVDEVVVHDLAEDGRPDLLVIPNDVDLQLSIADYAACRGNSGAVVLDAPNAAGLSFPIGSEMSIAWHRFQSAEVVDIEISHDSGQSWQSLARGAVHSPLSWTVTGPPTEGGLVRVRPADGSHLVDTSNAKFSLTAPSVDVPSPVAMPAEPSFAAPWPNPGRGSTRFRLALPVAGSPRVALYDVAGRRIRLLHEGPLPAGEHALVWDGRNDAGQAAGAGIYFARAAWADFRAERRVVRLD